MGKVRQTIAGGYRYSCKDQDTGDLVKHGYCRSYTAPAFQDEAAKTTHLLKFHNSDHLTAAEAKACYREYQLDQKLNLNKDLDWEQPCLIDQMPTTKGAEIEIITFPLCDAHRNYATVDSLYQGPYEDDL